MAEKVWLVHKAAELNGDGQFCDVCGADLLFGSVSHKAGELVVRHVAWRPGDPEFDRPDGEITEDERLCR